MVVVRRAASFLELIKFEHTVFALPFAYLGMLIAAGGPPTAWQFVWITVAMAAARTLGMGANRLIDQQLDARNPRTANRPLATGAISPRTVWIGCAFAAAILGLAAYALGPLTWRLYPGALLVLVAYPFTKRVTILSHFLLGATDALAPLGAWAAVRGSLFGPGDLPAWILFFAVTFWIAGFDLIYACQDIDFDRREHLHSVPARYGAPTALRLSAVCHAWTTLLLLVLAPVSGLGWIYFAGALAAGSLLAYEHAIITPSDLSRLDTAFFNINGVMSLTLLAATAVDLAVG
ncbi:MAG TPA: UbiA-like polyprenyltransferase [Anaerolineales bacterium]|nr:UbiA-like polyprenyltransferase [Anaerolineales bacterium]